MTNEAVVLLEDPAPGPEGAFGSIDWPPDPLECVEPLQAPSAVATRTANDPFRKRVTLALVGLISPPQTFR